MRAVATVLKKFYPAAVLQIVRKRVAVEVEQSVLAAVANKLKKQRKNVLLELTCISLMKDG